MKSSPSIHWFRQDLRLSDNPAFSAACATGAVLPIYILDDDNAGTDRMGSASRWWLHQSLGALNLALGGKLRVFKGNPLEIIPTLAKATDAGLICWNRCYEPWRIARDTVLKAALENLVLLCNPTMGRFYGSHGTSKRVMEHRTRFLHPTSGGAASLRHHRVFLCQSLTSFKSGLALIISVMSRLMIWGFCLKRIGISNLPDTGPRERRVPPRSWNNSSTLVLRV